MEEINYVRQLFSLFLNDDEEIISQIIFVWFVLDVGNIWSRCLLLTQNMWDNNQKMKLKKNKEFLLIDKLKYLGILIMVMVISEQEVITILTITGTQEI